jgi:hypothetical protein
MTGRDAHGQRPAALLSTGLPPVSNPRYRTLWGGSKSLTTTGPGALGFVVTVVVPSAESPR